MDSAERTTTMNISLPAVLRDFVAERVAGGAYSSASEYVRELIRADRQRQQGQARLEELLVEGIASGPAADWTDEDWTALRARVAGRVAEGPSSRGTQGG
ncbi:MAG: type II toxin-antitoxin system ParD family antitoxin [Planctomycetes bacterium]|nr:type II toxin-antitoxin system ParD family antitoxin [Planctomycetota bacterium]